MKRMSKLFRIGVLSAAVAAVPVLTFSSAALAQYRVNQDGRALDANNQIGSNGNNPSNTNNAVNGNDIVTGNVTGGKQFRGNVPYHNAREFRGSAPGGTNLDNFIRQSSSADPNDSGSSYKVQTFYGTARTVDPPSNAVSGPIGTGGYTTVPPGTVVNRSIGDARMGAIDLGASMQILPQQGQLLMPGPVDPTAGQQYISATPLMGIRQFGANDNNAMGSITNTQYNPATGARLTPDQIESMRDEMNKAGGGQTTDQQQQQQQPGATPSQQGGAGNKAGATGASGTSGATPIAPAAINQQVAGATPIPGAQPVDAAINPALAGATGQGVRQKLPISAQQQSAVYAELLKRHEQDLLAKQDDSDADAARAYNAIQRAQQAVNTKGAANSAPGAPGPPGAPGAPGAAPGAAPAAPGGAAPGGLPAVPAVPPPAGAQSSTPAGVTDYAKQNQQLMQQMQKDQARMRPMRARPAPVKVNSFATGMKGKGLSEVMKNAETLMKDGKFTNALDEYDKAEQVAPNNPLIRLGRANAELGAAYYARAEAHLRDAFNSNPELLNGQYDLTALLGESRVQTLVRDLKDIMNKEQREPRPVFLLAYIAYNTGHEQNAEAYLDLADKRSGGRDPFFKLLRDNWSLPNAKTPGAGAGATTQMSK